MPRELLIRFWSDTERHELKKLFDQAWPVRKIAWRLKRSNSAIRREMMLLRLFVRDRQAGSQAQDELSADLVVQASRSPAG